MKKLLLVLTIISVFFTFGCKKEDKVKTYSLTFNAKHWVSQENQFCDPFAYYGWTVEDKNSNSKYDKSGTIVRATVYGTTTAISGDWIFIYISVNDVFDNGSVSCTSSDGSISLHSFTDNLYIDESDDVTAERIVNVNNQDTIIKVKKIRCQLK